MDTLFAILTPIGLIDSTSIIPLSLIPMAVLLSGKRPLASVSAYITGIFVTYFACGLLILFGLGEAFQTINEYISYTWKNPNTPDVVAQIVVGIVLAAIGYKLCGSREKREDKKTPKTVTPVGAFLFACGITIVGMPGALPYVAAIDQILRADFSVQQNVLAIGYYNAVFILPLVALVVTRQMFPRRADRIFAAINRIADSWGQRLIVTLLVILGLVLTADGIGWFLGHPLLPM